MSRRKIRQKNANFPELVGFSGVFVCGNGLAGGGNTFGGGLEGEVLGVGTLTLFGTTGGAGG